MGQTIVSTDEETKTPTQLVQSVIDEYEADVLFYSGAINDSGLGRLIQEVLQHKERDTVLLILTTVGGSGNSAYQIARFLQKMYKNFILYAPSYCMSAGTLVALGAHQLILDPFSELGPLDVQLFKENELGTRKSGLQTRSAFEGLAEASFDLFESLMLNIMRKSGGLVGFRVAADLSAEMTGKIMSSVYCKIDPDVVGSDRRDLDVALHYGMRLAKIGENADPVSIYRLVNSYPSHDFIIDDDEARDLFTNVSFPSKDLMRIAGLLNAGEHTDAGSPTVSALIGTQGNQENNSGEVVPNGAASNEAQDDHSSGDGPSNRSDDRAEAPAEREDATASSEFTAPISEAPS